MDAFDWLHNILWEAQEGCDVFIEMLVSDPESIKSIGKEHINRASSVYKNSTDIVIENIGVNDHGVEMWDDNALLLIFWKGDYFLADLSDFGIEPFGQT